MKVGDVYPTRDGRTAIVTYLSDVDTARIEIVNKPEGHFVFTDSGRANYPGGGDRPYDLILPPKTVKVQRVIEYEGSEEWVKDQMNAVNNICYPGHDFKANRGTIHEVSRKFL